MITIDIILGSSRKNALGKNLFNYLQSQKNLYEKSFNVNLKFMAVGDYDLPFFYESEAPMNNKDRQLPDQQAQWVTDVKNADGYIFVTPEYNHSFPAVLKNALDYLADQAKDKPALVMSYSDTVRAGQFGGADLVPILTRLGIYTLPPLFAIGNVQKNFDVDGKFLEDAPSRDFYETELKQVVEKIAFYSNLLHSNPFVPSK